MGTTLPRSAISQGNCRSRVKTPLRSENPPARRGSGISLVDQELSLFGACVAGRCHVLHKAPMSGYGSTVHLPHMSQLSTFPKEDSRLCASLLWEVGIVHQGET